jgi:shikimate kinase
MDSCRRNNVFLVGPMGVGKSTIGRHLAKLLKMDFVDSDHEIERRTGVTIAVIFEIEGEAGFRAREAAVLSDLTDNRGNLILATGGGAVLRPANREILCTRGLVVYLHAAIDILLKRTHRDHRRPLLQTADPRRIMQELLEHRDPLYREVADLVVETDQRSPTTVAREVAAKLKPLMTDANPQT